MYTKGSLWPGKERIGTKILTFTCTKKRWKVIRHDLNYPDNCQEEGNK